MKRFLTGRSRSLVAGLALFVLALVPRALNLDAFVVWDELDWVHFSIRFLAALQRGDWAGTFQIGHPGVMTMWAEAAAISFRPGLDPDTLARLAQQAVVGDPESFRGLAQVLFATKISIGLLTAAGVAGIFWLARQFWGDAIAFLGAALIALDPFFLANSRMLHLDALLTTFLTLSALSLLGMTKSQTCSERSESIPNPKPQIPMTNGQIPNVFIDHWDLVIGIWSLGFGHWSLVISAVAASLAFLTKSTALLILPFVSIVLVVGAWLSVSEKPILSKKTGFFASLLASGLTWGGLAAVTYIVAWPAMWADPVGTLGQVFGNALTYAETPHENSIFFLGAPRGDPGPLFYPVNLAFHLTPLTLLAAPAGLAALIWRWGRWATPGGRRALLELLVYTALFMLLLTFGAKKSERYLLPVFPAVNLLAAVGIIGLAEHVANGRWQRANGNLLAVGGRRSAVIAAIALAVVTQAASVLPYHPYYLAYFNPVVGGAQLAVRLVPIGLGEGMELAGRYLDQQRDATEVAVWNVPAFAPYYRGQIQSVANYNPATADYVVLYVSQLQRKIFQDVMARYEGQPPEATFRVHSIDYAWIYRNRSYEAPLAYLTAQANPTTDIIVFDEASLVARHYSGPVSAIVPKQTKDEARLVEELRTAAAGRQRIWYVTYPDGRGDHQRPVHYQLATHAYQESVHDFPEVRVVRYRLSPAPEFRVAQLERQPDIDFDGQMNLRGMGLDRPMAEWGRGLGVVAEWIATRPLDANYTAFLHLEDEQGQLWGQVDQPLRDAEGRPTSEWSPGEAVTTRHSLSLLPGTPPGRYVLKLGVYEYSTGRRLGLRTAGTTQGTEYEVGSVDVIPSPLIPSPEALDIPHRTGAELPEQLRWLGSDRIPESIRPGQSLSLTLFWQALGAMGTQYAARFQLRDRAGTVIAEATSSLAPAYPTDRWRPGDIIRGRYNLPLKVETLGGDAQLVVQVLDPAGTLAAEWPLGKIQIEAVSRRFDIPPIQHPQRAILGDNVALLGYDSSVEGCKLNIEGPQGPSAPAPRGVGGEAPPRPGNSRRELTQ